MTFFSFSFSFSFNGIKVDGGWGQYNPFGTVSNSRLTKQVDMDPSPIVLLRQD